MFKKIKIWWEATVFYIKAKIIAKRRGVYYELTPAGKEAIEYCVRVMSNTSYTYTTYSEQKIYEAVQTFAQAHNISFQEAASEFLLILLGAAK